MGGPSNALSLREMHYEPNCDGGPIQLEGAFRGAYRHYRIDRLPGMDLDTFFTRTRRFLIEVLTKESCTEAIRSQATTLIRFRNDGETVELAFNSRILNVYNLSDMTEKFEGSCIIKLYQA